MLLKIQAIIGVLLVAAGIWIAFNGYHMWTWNDRRLNYEPANGEVDLSVAGKYEMPFRKKYQTKFGKQLRFEIEPRFATKQEMVAAFESFKAVLEIKSQDGETVTKSELVDVGATDDISAETEWFKPQDLGRVAPLDSTTPNAYLSDTGETGEQSTLILTVLSPVAEVAGRQQRLVVKNVISSSGESSEFLGGPVIGIGVLVLLFGVSMIQSYRDDRRKRAAEPAKPASPPQEPEPEN